MHHFNFENTLIFHFNSFIISYTILFNFSFSILSWWTLTFFYFRFEVIFLEFVYFKTFDHILGVSYFLFRTLFDILFYSSLHLYMFWLYILYFLYFSCTWLHFNKVVLLHLRRVYMNAQNYILYTHIYIYCFYVSCLKHFINKIDQIFKLLCKQNWFSYNSRLEINLSIFHLYFLQQFLWLSL